MKVRLNYPFLLAFVLFLVAGSGLAHAQQSNASVVASCGSATYVAGRQYPQTQDTTGSLCTGATISGGTLVINPSASSTAGNAPVPSTSLEANHVIKGSAGNLYAFEVAADSTLSGAAWWVMVYNATSAPADGAVTPAKCYAVPSGTTNFSAGWGSIPAYFSTGITIGVSTTGCFTKTASAHAFISAEAK